MKITQIQGNYTNPIFVRQSCQEHKPDRYIEAACGWLTHQIVHRRDPGGTIGWGAARGVMYLLIQVQTMPGATAKWIVHHEACTKLADCGEVLCAAATLQETCQCLHTPALQQADMPEDVP